MEYVAASKNLDIGVSFVIQSRAGNNNSVFDDFGGFLG